MVTLRLSFKRVFLVFCMSLLAGCQLLPAVNEKTDDEQQFVSEENQRVTLTPFQPQTNEIEEEIKTVEPRKVWFSPALPRNFSEQIDIPTNAIKTGNAETGDIRIDVTEEPATSVEWYYLLVTPFPELVEDVTLQEIMQTWQGDTSLLFGGSSLYVSPQTHAAFSQRWGEASASGVIEMPDDELLDYCWSHQPCWALIPFEELQPRWKVIRVDGSMPLEADFNADAYPLKIRFGYSLESAKQDVDYDDTLPSLPDSNFDPQKLTSVLITGVTALVRATGAKMEENGMDYPGEVIRDWMLSADFTHISNEVSFAPDCPPADPYQIGLRFCSRPEYYELLDYVDVDVVELSGNHLVDWSQEAFDYTLDLYRQKGMPYFAGGVNREDAQKPFLIEHHGNKIALLGCNPAGPEKVWATDEHSGAANCEDYQWIKDEIASLRQDGYLPIVTLQYNEHYAITPTDFQKRDFPPLMDAGAVIVSGSQAHYPNGMEFRDDGFIHYGLGNLFFDQMDFLFPGVQREFLDMHYFYDGRYINTVLLTAELEDYSQPRPMTDDERSAFLKEAFKASGW